MGRIMTWTVLLSLLPGPAQAAPLSSGPVSVAEDGSVSIHQARVARVTLPPGPRSLQVREIAVRGRARVLAIKVSGRGGRAAEVIMLAPPKTSKAGAMTLIFAGTTGAQGVDSEWSRHLRVDSSGILLFSRRDGATRCDRAPVHLFPKLYDFSSGSFRPVSSVPRVAGAAEIRATRASALPPLTEGPLNTFRLTFASTHTGDGQQASALGPPREAEDGQPATAWFEGLGGAGRGEFLTARALPSPYKLRALTIIPGHARDRGTFRKANRIKSALLVFDEKQQYRVIFPKDPLRDKGRVQDPYWIVLPQPLKATCATLIIDQVYPGSLASKGGGRTAISELRFFTDLEFEGGVARLLKDLGAEDLQRGQAAVAVLSRLGSRAVRLVGSQLHESASLRTLVRINDVLIRSRDPAAAAPLANLLPRLDPPHRASAMAALQRLGPGAAPPLIPLLDQKDPILGREVALLLGTLGGAQARAALLARAGAGSEERRAAVVDALARLSAAGDLQAVLAAAEQTTAASRKADLVMTAGRLGRRLQRQQPTAARLARMWPAAEDFQLRYRLIAAIGALHPDGHLTLLRSLLSHPDRILRWLAAQQVGRATAGEAVPALVGALKDACPRVRASAAEALGRREASPLIQSALSSLLLKEQWGSPAAEAAEALGRHCGRQAVAALREAVRRGPRGLAVDSRALLSIVRCRPRGLEQFLLTMAEESRWRPGIRQRALSLITPSMARVMGQDLVAFFTRQRLKAPTAEAEEKVAIAAAGALPMTGSRAAALALANALALDPLPSIRLAAALALGSACHKVARSSLRRAVADADPKVRRAARQSVKQCKQGTAIP